MPRKPPIFPPSKKKRHDYMKPIPSNELADMAEHYIDNGYSRRNDIISRTFYVVRAKVRLGEAIIKDETAYVKILERSFADVRGPFNFKDILLILEDEFPKYGYTVKHGRHHFQNIDEWYVEIHWHRPDGSCE